MNKLNQYILVFVSTLVIGSSVFAEGSYSHEFHKSVHWTNTKHVTFTFKNINNIPMYVSMPSSNCVEHTISTTKLDPLQTWSTNKLKFHWDDALCGTLERLPSGQAPWPITSNSIYVEVNVSKSPNGKSDYYCGGYFTLWGSSLDGKVKKVSFWMGEPKGGAPNICDLKFNDNADNNTLIIKAPQ